MSQDKGLNFELNISEDHHIDLPNLRDEFSKFPIILYAYSEAKADAEKVYDLDKSFIKEIEAQVYVELKTSGEKYTENHAKAAVDCDPRVLEARKKMYDSKRTYNTLRNYVETLHSKKDMLMQLGADLRKEK